MGTRFCRSVCALLVVIATLGTSPARAEKRSLVGTVTPGLAKGEVLKRLGPPEEKREYETSRREIWSYRGGEYEVIFEEGRVQSEVSGGHEVLRPDDPKAPLDALPEEYEAHRPKQAKPRFQGSPKSIFGEIMKAGEEDEPGDVAQPRPGVPPQPVPID